MESSERSFKEKRIREMTFIYYSMPEIRKALLQFSANRECIPRYYEGFGKRPDTFQYESDISEQVRKGATSFHSSEELWSDPLEISTELRENEINELRIGWDFLIDIDSKYIDYSKISAQLLIQALEFHGVKNIGIKFSGSKGFHIIIPWKSFPKEIYGHQTKNMFPEWPRLVCQYLTEMIKPQLIEKISDLMHKGRKSYIKDFEAPKQVMPDIILVSPRHLFRMPYSLHEKTSLASVVIDKDKIQDFQIQDANPLKVKVKNFIPQSEPEEAKELLLQAIDWEKTKKQEKTSGAQEPKQGTYKEVIIKDFSPNLYPPCIKNILNGIKQDGRKRAFFLLISFFKSLKLSDEEIEKRIAEWNEKNYNPLKQGYLQAQFNWHKKNPARLPPNCDKPNYKDLAVCNPDPLCNKIKNPVNYAVRKFFTSRKLPKRKFK